MATYRVEMQLLPARRGQVYRALDEERGAQVILRTFPLRNAEARQAPLHEGACKVLESGRFRERAYLVCEYLAAPTVEVVGGDAARVLVALLRTVASAHAEGIVHGHLRPHNVHLVPGRGPVITDYGVPWFDGDPAGRARIEPWLPPEQRSNLRSASPASDVWGLGSIAHYLLVGGPPVEGADPAADLEGSGALVSVVRAMLRPEQARRTTCRQALVALGEEMPALAAR